MNYLILVFFIVYFYFYFLQIYNWIKVRKQLNELLDIAEKTSDELKRLNSSASYSFDYDVTPIKKNMIKEMPKIDFVLKYTYNRLSLTQSPDNLLSSYKNIVSELYAKNNELVYLKISFLNPIRPFEEIFLLPSRVLNWFGLNLSAIPGRIFSVLSWIFIYLFKSNASELFLKLLDSIKSLFS